MVSNTSVSCARNGNGKNDTNQIADNERVVHAGCGVNALSGLQSHANSTYCSLLVGLISAAHQAILRLSSVTYQ
ncbi:hypothetical protein A311_04874 [Escherichia coli KTE146]|nr:hypothetical protein A311_04874 [Escherichia coli KTE146]